VKVSIIALTAIAVLAGGAAGAHGGPLHLAAGDTSKPGGQSTKSTIPTVTRPAGTPTVSEPSTGGAIRGRPGSGPAGSPPAPCITDPSQISARSASQGGHVTASLRMPPPPPKPMQTNAPAPPAGALAVQARQPLAGDLSPQLCESLKTGVVTNDEVSAVLQTMEKEHAGKTQAIRKQVQVGPVSYTYEYALQVGGLRFYQKPGTGYCSDFDWRFLVRNISQQNFTVFSTTGEVGLCFSPGFGLFYIPGLATAMPFPVPGLCFDDAALTKLDLRNVSDRFEDELVHLINLAFAKLRRADAKVCIIGAAYPPWFAPVIIPPSNMVVYCTSTRHCEFDVAKLAQAAGNKR
jgi:hypothetical protein